MRASAKVISRRCSNPSRKIRSAAASWRKTRSPEREGESTKPNKLRASRYTLVSAFNDDPSRAGAASTLDVRLQGNDRGKFRVPSLRGVSDTAPFMHDGSLATLRDVVDRYSRLERQRLPKTGETSLSGLGLRADEVEDLLTFLHTLASDG